MVDSRLDILDAYGIKYFYRIWLIQLKQFLLLAPIALSAHMATSDCGDLRYGVVRDLLLDIKF